MELKDRLREARIKEGLTQKALAGATGIHEVTIRQYESGRRNPKLEPLRKISTALGVPLGVFVGAAVTEGVITPEEVWTLTEKQPGKHAQLIGHFDKLNSLGKDVAIERVEELTKIPDYQEED